VTAIGGRPMPEFWFLPSQLRLTLLPKECYGNSCKAQNCGEQIFLI